MPFDFSHAHAALQAHVDAQCRTGVSAVASLNGEVIDKFCIGLKFEEAMFVLHCFQKKSKHGIATPKEDMEIIWARLKVAELLAKELRDGKAHR